MDQAHSYQQLPDAQTYVRILNILGRDEDHVLSLTLKTVKLASVDNEYDAISYAWGPATPLKLVRIDGREFKVRENIWRFLNYCCNTDFRHEHHRNLWIDAICINQVNEQEKSQQVQSMRYIFMGARRVLCWLGYASEASFCIDGPSGKKTPLAAVERQMKGLFCAYEPIDMGFPANYNARRLGARLWPLVTDVYWSRLWIVQEVCLARSALVISSIGLIRMEYMWHIADSPSWPHSDLHERETVTSKRIDQIARLQSMFDSSRGYVSSTREERRLDPLTVCVSFLDFSCHEPRDHLYAILGLVDPEGKFHADYSESSGDTLRRLLMFMADQKTPFKIENFLTVAETLAKEPCDPSRKPQDPDLCLADQLCYVQFDLESCLEVLPASDCRHKSIESWAKCLAGAPSMRAFFCPRNETKIKCLCGCLWPSVLDVAGTAANCLYTRTAFRIFQGLATPHKLVILLALPNESFEVPTPLTPTVIVVMIEESFDCPLKSCYEVTACTLSGPLQEDLHAYHTAHIQELLDGAANKHSPYAEVPLRAKSLVQLWDIYDEFKTRASDTPKDENRRIPSRALLQSYSGDHVSC